MKSIGYLYLIETFKLNVCELQSRAHLTNKSVREVHRQNDGIDVYYPVGRIKVEDSWQGNLLFALKHEGVNLEVLKAFFAQVSPTDVVAFVKTHPTGVFNRRVWALYELLMGQRLPLQDLKQGSYLLLAEEKHQIVRPLSASVRIRRMRLVNNLLGDQDFSPFVRRTDIIDKYNAQRLKRLSDALLKRYSPELLYRAIHYLYVKETRSSFAIERETPDQGRMQSFVSILRRIPDSRMTKETLVDLQNQVVDERYRQSGWRQDQVYVGETVMPGREKVHFIAARPQDVEDLMAGFLRTLETLMRSSVDPVVLAAIMSFAFVFIHPFDDGNGRLHRYLMHFILSQMGFTPKDIIFPVSAVLLKRPDVYDRMLETFSRRVMPRLDYEIDPEGEITVKNESVDFYRYIDFTEIVEDFQRVIVETIRSEWRTELDYLVDYDRIREGMRQIVDLPEKKANQFILFVKNNRGRLSAAKRHFFGELTDEEVRSLEQIVCPSGADE